MKNNDEILNVFVLSKHGDKDAQKRILLYVKEVCHPLVLAFYPNVKKLNMDYSDLEDLLVEALFNIYQKVEVNEIYDFKNLIKFYYMKAVQSEIRYRSKNNKFGYHVFSLDDPNNTNDLYLAKNTYYEKKNEVLDYVNKDIVYNDAIRKNNAKLSVREKKIIELFLSDVTIKEISSKLKISYQTTYKHIKNALNKVKAYILENYKDIEKYD